MKTAQQRSNLSFLLCDDSLMGSGFCRIPITVVHKFELFIRVDWFNSHVDWWSWQEKLPQIQTTIWQGVIKQRFLSLQLKWAVFSMNGTWVDWKRHFYPLLYCLYFFYCLFFPANTNYFGYQMAFFNVQFKLLSIVFILIIPAKHFKEIPLPKKLTATCPTLGFEFHSHVSPPSSRHEIFLMLLYLQDSSH